MHFKRLIMTPAFISIFFFLFNFIVHKDIVVEHNYLPRINASSIADEVTTFELDKDYTFIQDLLITEDHYFITPVGYEDKGFTRSISKLDKSGQYIEEIYRSKEVINTMTYDSTVGNIIIGFNRGMIIFNTNKNAVVKEVKTDRFITKIKLFKDKLYVAGVQTSGDSEIYYLDLYDAASLKFIETKKEIKYAADERLKTRIPSLSSSNNELFVAMGNINEIYSSRDGFKIPIISFKNIYNNKPKLGNIRFSANQGVVGNFATTIFGYSNNWYVFFYDLDSHKQYLSKTGSNSGLYDDVNRSGYYSPKFTNSNEYMFSSTKSTTNDNEISVILLKIKS